MKAENRLYFFEMNTIINLFDVTCWYPLNTGIFIFCAGWDYTNINATV